MNVAMKTTSPTCELGNCPVRRDASCCLVCQERDCPAVCRGKRDGDESCVWQKGAYPDGR